MPERSTPPRRYRRWIARAPLGIELEAWLPEGHLPSKEFPWERTDEISDGLPKFPQSMHPKGEANA